MSGAVATTLQTERAVTEFIRDEGVRIRLYTLCLVHEISPSPLFQEDEQQRGHHGAKTKTRHRHGRGQLKETEREFKT